MKILVLRNFKFTAHDIRTCTYLLQWVSGTRNGPSRNDTARPTSILMLAMAVDVTLSDGGNHLAEIRGPAPRATGAESPLKKWPTLMRLQDGREHTGDVSKHITKGVKVQDAVNQLSMFAN